MAKARPVSLIVSSGAFDESPSHPKSAPRSAQLHGHSSSSSIDSSSLRNSMPQAALNATTTPSTSTDSEMDSEHDEQQSSEKAKNSRNASEQSSRRFKHFQKLFKSEIKEEMPRLIDSYVCAYQGDILLQGKMYITDRYLCFHSRIISYVTKHVYRWEQIQGVTKERVAFIFPTAIGIQFKPNGKKVVYASFIQRDQAFEKILLIWSRATGEIGSLDEDETDPHQDGTLKAVASRTGRNKRTSYHPGDVGEHEEVLQMYLNDERSDDKHRMHSLSSKSSEERNSRKAEKRSLSVNPAATEATLTNGAASKNAVLLRHPRENKNEPKALESTKKDASRDSRLVQDQAPSLANPPSRPSPSNASDESLWRKILQVFLSLLSALMRYLSSSFEQLKSYPLKATAALFLFVILLVFHSFYLIQLAYRIEDRLQSLHHLWPSSFAKSPPLPARKEL